MVATTDITRSKIIQPESLERFLLTGISWETYERLSNDLERSGCRFRLTFDADDLEMELPNELHEALKSFIRSMVETFLIRRRIRHAPLSATTWRRRLMSKGLQADECYYVHHSEAIGLGLKVDLDRDPVPDLAIEIEVTSPLVAKIPIYAALGVPEIWQIDSANRVSILVFEDGQYRPAQASSIIPVFTVLLLEKYLALRMTVNHFDALEKFQAEVLPMPPA